MNVNNIYVTCNLHAIEIKIETGDNMWLQQTDQQTVLFVSENFTHSIVAEKFIIFVLSLLYSFLFVYLFIFCLFVCVPVCDAAC